jgi:hypothetical protein
MFDTGGAMASGRKWQESIRLGFQVFQHDGGEEIGAVREICPAERPELLVHIENSGDHCIPLDAIVDVHSEKVIVDPTRLAPEVRSAIAHAHDAERPGAAPPHAL